MEMNENLNHNPQPAAAPAAMPAGAPTAPAAGVLPGPAPLAGPASAAQPVPAQPAAPGMAPRPQPRPAGAAGRRPTGNTGAMPRVKGGNTGALPRQMPAGAAYTKQSSVWGALYKVCAWVLCILIVAGGTGAGVWLAYDNYGYLTELVPILIMAGAFVASAALGLGLLSAMMQRSAMAKDLIAIRKSLEAAKTPR